jgi:predicted O-linked N-acetylglucosamine transferase (SPINDLY family)
MDSLMNTTALPPETLGSPASALPVAVPDAAPSLAQRNDPVYYFDRGNLLFTHEKYDEAIAAFRRSIELRPDFAEAHNNLGMALSRIGDTAAAAACYIRALKLVPDHAPAHNNLGCAFILLGELAAAIHHYKRAISIDPERSSAYTNLVLALQYVPGVSSALIAETTRRWAATVRRRPRRTPWPNLPVAERRIRIGYVSGDFRRHPVAYFTESVLAAHDRAAVEIFCYSNVAMPDEITDRIAVGADHWQSISALEDGEAARLIAADEIDILIDLSGHTAANRLTLFASRPAPIQCTWLGYAGTTGLPEIDYIIGDRFVLPPEEAQLCTEQPFRLPNSYLCFTPPEAEIAVTTLPALSGGRLTFGCFNNLLKLNNSVVALWSALLAAVPNSQLFLKTAQLHNPDVCDRLESQFAAHGIAADRLILSPSSPREELLRAYNHVDIALDPFPFGGGTTTIEALWMGVPVVTLRGTSFVGHVGESILATLGLPGLVAADPSDYLAKAVRLASALPELAALRQSLRDRLLASPLCDAPRFARDLEAGYRAMWEAWCRARQIAA